MKFSIEHRNKSILVGLLSFLLMFTLSASLLNSSAEAVSRSELSTLKQQQTQLAAQKAGIQAQADALNNKIASQTETLEILTSQLELTNAEIENLAEQIAIYTNSIAQMENRLTLDKQKEQELLEHFKIRVRAMEEGGQYSYISILFDASSFEDLLARIDCIKSIMKYDNDLLDELREAQVKVRTAKTNMEAEMAEQEIVFADYQQKQADLQSQQEEVEAVLSSLTENSEDYQKQLETVKALQSALGTQIGDMEDRLAEQARIQAEQNASNQISNGGTGGSNSGGGSSWYGDSAGTGTGQDIIDYAKTFLGVKYVYGGTSPSGFDCSGLVYYCYRHYGYTVNRTAAGLAYSGKTASASSLQVGDVILFTSQDGSYIGHTGLYIGGGQFIHAPHTGDVVKISNLSDTYYANHYWGARRIVS